MHVVAWLAEKVELLQDCIKTLLCGLVGLVRPLVAGCIKTLLCGLVGLVRPLVSAGPSHS